MPQSDDAGAGQGGKVDHRLGLVAVRIIERVAQDQAALGVSVENLDRLTRGAGDDVAGLHGAAAGHVLAGRYQSDQIDPEFGARREIDRRQHRGGAAHIVFHLIHRRRVLERDAAGVEGDALAYQHQWCAAAARAAIFQHDETRRLGAAASDGQQATHLQAPDPGLIEHAHAYAASIAALERACLGRHIARRAHVGGQVAQISQQLRALAHGRSSGEPAAYISRGVAFHRAKHNARQCRRTRTPLGLEVVDAVQTRAHDFRGAASEVIVVELGGRGPLQRDGGRRNAGTDQGGDGVLHRAPPAAAVELRFGAQAHQQQPSGGQSGHLRKQQCLAAAAGEIATRQHSSHPAAQAAVHRRRFRAQLAALEGADYQTIAALDRGPAAEGFESHRLIPCLPAKYSYNVAPAAA